MLQILIVDDETRGRAFLAATVRRCGCEVSEAGSEAEALLALADRKFDLVIASTALASGGLQIVEILQQEFPTVFVAVYSDTPSVEEAVTLLQAGACDYATRPFDLTHFPAPLLQRVEAKISTQQQLAAARQHLVERDPTCPIVGSSPLIRQMLEQLDTFAQSDASLLIVGESGTGKELVAQRLHQRSRRHDKPFVIVNCAALPETLLEAELFGHEKGAFTGALQKRHGRFKCADGGTILLDEVAELPPSSQAKLLRVLQEGEFQPLGSNHSIHVNVRVISATHQNLAERVQRGTFREDLFYRLRVLDIAIPPLRQRMSDFPTLVEYFFQKYAAGKNPTIRPAAWAKLIAYSYPGNVRELAHVIERAVILSHGDEIDLTHLPVEIAGAVRPPREAQRFQSLHAAMWQFEEQYLREALDQAHGKRNLAAQLLGISRKNLWQKLHSHGLDLTEPLAESTNASGRSHSA